MATSLRLAGAFFPVFAPLSGDNPAARRRNFAVSGGDRRRRVAAETPARDRVVDFGKYKGRMLGTLPSSYLGWISRNLRAGDTEEWARLADQVLVDDVYRDRLEWETAHRLLSGDGADLRRRPVSEASPSAALLDVSRRFGWDNDDREGWSRVDFELLGTSRGGRIPRRKVSPGGGEKDSSAAAAGGRVARLSDGPRFTAGSEVGAAAAAEDEKREQRRMRLRMKREQRTRELKRDLGLRVVDGGSAGGETPPASREGNGGAAAAFNSHAHLRGLLNKIRGREP